ncbi:MAG: hypothetical protein EA425_09450 [Puniceicoccaceae bacterium]|nr:MAG: hypothetical protein EA425_09450 [Puniceicoccaceae bacterium]
MSAAVLILIIRVDLRPGGRALVRAGVLLQLGDGEIKREEGVLAGLGELLGRGRDPGLDPGQGGQADQEQNQKSQ